MPTHSATVLRRLGSGVSIMTAALTRMRTEDWDGLAHRVGHVRVCGSVVEPLIDWSLCPGATRRFDSDTQAVDLLRRSVHFERFKAAASAAQQAGLAIVLNPMQQLHTLEVSASTLRWVWMAMLAEFSTAEWPAERVVFELVNEPGNFQNHSVSGGRFVEMLPALLRLISSAQPSRVMIVGGEMGSRADFEGGRKFVNSGPALVLDAPTIAALAARHHLVGTFHFYRPRAFTNQGMPDVHSMAQPRWQGTATEVDDLAQHFAAVRSALNATPVYLGEFGINVEAVPERSDGVAWLRTVRSLAERSGFAWALWTYSLSPKGVTAADSASERLRQWDCSDFVQALFERRASCRRGRALDANTSERFRQAVRRRERDRDGLRGGCNDRRPEYADQLLAAVATNMSRRTM